MLKFSAATFFIGMATGYIYFDDPLAGLVIFLCLYGVYPAYKSNEKRKLKQLMMVQFKDLLYSVSASLSLGRNMRQALEESLSFWGNTYDEKDPIMIEVRKRRGCFRYNGKQSLGNGAHGVQDRSYRISIRICSAEIQERTEG